MKKWMKISLILAVIYLIIILGLIVFYGIPAWAIFLIILFLIYKNKMGWNNRSYSKKGAFVGIVIGIISRTYLIYIPFRIGRFGFHSIIDNIFFLIYLFVFVIIGAVIGRVIEKIKSKKK